MTGTARAPNGGIFDRFEGFRTLSAEATQKALAEGLVVIDANVLLNLYRYDDTSREDLLRVLEALGDRLHVPHQAMLEFWRTRESALTGRVTAAEGAAERLQSVRDDARKIVGEWANRLAVAPEARADLLNRLTAAFEDVVAAVEASAGDTQAAASSDTSLDPVIERLEPMLAGKVGSPLGSEKLQEVLKEARRRLEAGLPPGYKDKDKDGDGAAGDYLIWAQALEEVQRQSASELVFVTGDVKEDWWRRERGELRGPRIELFDEAAEQSGATLYMLTPQSLVRHAQTALGLDIQEGTVSRIEQAQDPGDSGGTSWTREVADEFLARLHSEAPVQHEAILAAIANGGVVTRKEVYQIGNYDPSRTLRGFTRPARRIMEQLQNADLLSLDAPEPLETVYEPRYSFVVAWGFRVPEEIVSLYDSEGAERS